MKKSLTILIFSILVVTLIKFSQDLAEQEQLLQSKDEKLIELIDTKIADYQFHFNIHYRGKMWKDGFFDSLNTCFEMLRICLPRTDIPDSSKSYLQEFMMDRLSGGLGRDEDDMLRMIDLESMDSIFIGANLRIVERVLEVLNPYFLTRCFYFTDIDIWKYEENWNLHPGDTTSFMIRLLKNHDFLQHQLEFVETENLEVINPYLGKLKVVIPDDINDKSFYDLPIHFYDWIKKDTVIQTFGISLN